MNTYPLVSIVINNYNYARYLKEAIDSALAQTFPALEVVVVDDGSDDDSRSIINSYGPDINSVFKSTGGQASAMNAGATACTGDYIVFLDSDDILRDHFVAEVVEAFRSNQDVVKVQCRMQVVDAQGKPNGETIPPLHRPFRTGDLRGHVVRHHSYTWPCTSAIAYNASILRTILPIPDDIYRISGDEYLAYASVLKGPIVSLGQVGCSYRVHGQNNFATSKLDLKGMKATILRYKSGIPILHAIAEAEGLENFPKEVTHFHSLSLLVPLAIVRRLEPSHPQASMLTTRQLLRNVLLALRNPDIPMLRKVAHLVWFIFVLYAPGPVAESLCRARVGQKPWSQGSDTRA